MSKLRHILLNNWALKVLALILALISYQSIKDTISFEVSFEVPVEVDVEEGIAILNQDPRAVDVTFQGSQADLGQLSHGQMKIMLKATDPAGSEIITLKRGDVEGAAGVKVVNIRPKEVHLTFDRESEKRVSIAKPKVRGVPLIGTVEIDYEPKSATIKGPKGKLDNKNILDTEPIDVDGRVQSFTKRVRILPPADAMISTIEPSEVEVTVSISTDTISREWTNVPVTAMSPPGTAWVITVEPQTVNVQLHGRKDLIEGIKDNIMTAFVDCMTMKPGSSSKRPVNVYMPSGPDLTTTVSPETVKVTVSEPPKQKQGTEGE